MWIKIFRNSFSVLVSNVLILLSSLGLYAIIGRKLGVDGLGEISFVLAFIGIFAFLPDLGMSLYLIHEVAKDITLSQIFLGRSLTLVLLLSPISCGIIILITSQLNLDSNVSIAIYLATVYLMLGAFIGLMRASFHAHERMELETFVITLERLSTFIICLIILWLGYGLIALICGHIISRFIAFLASLVIYTKKIDDLPALEFNKSSSISMIRHAMPFALNIMTTTIYIQADLILLSLWIGEQASGYYKAATSLVVPLAVIATSLNSAMFPRITQAYLITPAKAKGLLEFSMRYLFLLGWPMALGLIVLAPAIIRLIYGADFAPSILILQILALIIPLRFINNTMGTGLTAINQQKNRAYIIFLSAIFNLILNIFLIPRLSYFGASISTFLTELLITFALYFTLTISLGRLTFQKKFLRIFLSGMIMLLIAYLLRETHFLIVVVISAITYCMTLILFKAFPQPEIIRIKDMTQNMFFKS